jgi:hypothetical protein
MSPGEFKVHFHFEMVLLAAFLFLVAAFTTDATIALIAMAICVWAVFSAVVGVCVERRRRRLSREER